jgi:hypothetical protein
MPWKFGCLSFIIFKSDIGYIIKLADINTIIINGIHHVHTLWETAYAACSGVMLSNGVNAVKSSHRTMPKL